MKVTIGSIGMRTSRGFTLIELMITVVIVGILASIAYPSYLNSIRKTRRTQAVTIMLETSQKLERCFTRFSSYADAGCDTATTLAGAGIMTPGNFYKITSTPTASAYTLTATPQADQIKDTICANLTLNQASAHGASGSQPASCW